MRSCVSQLTGDRKWRSYVVSAESYPASSWAVKNAWFMVHSLFVSVPRAVE
jgi:hypothetical protein